MNFKNKFNFEIMLFKLVICESISKSVLDKKKEEYDETLYFYKYYNFCTGSVN